MIRILTNKEHCREERLDPSSWLMKKFSIQEITEVIAFAVSEGHRTNELSKTDPELYVQEVGIHGSLPSERGDFPHGHYSCSKAAIRRLAEVAQQRIESDHELRGRIVLGSYFGPLKAEIGVRCIRNGEPVTKELTLEVLKAAKAKALAMVTSGTYYFPVFSADETQGLNSYMLGPVSFERTQDFFQRTATEWENSIVANIADRVTGTTASDVQFATDEIRGGYSRIKDHFVEHRWMASVHIDSAEDDIGYEHAERVIDLACTLLRLWLPSWRDSFIGLSSHRLNDRDTACFTLSKSGRYNYVFATGSEGDSVEVGFISKLRAICGVDQIEAALCKLAQWSELTKAEERLVSALSWFGEAWKEKRTEAKIVKFSMCLESLLMTGGKEGLTELLSERIALLLGSDYESRKQYYSEARTIYDARSQAVHGDMRGSDLDFVRAARKAEEVASLTLVTYAQLIPILGRSADIKPVLNDYFTALKLGGMEAGQGYLRQFASAGGHKSP